MLDFAAKDKQFGTTVKVWARYKRACRGIALPRTGGGRHCQTQGETPLRGRAAQSSLWVWGPDGAGSSAPGEALGRGEEGAGRLRQKAERRLKIGRAHV